MQKLEITSKLAKTFKKQYKEIVSDAKKKDIDLKDVRWYFEYNVQIRQYMSVNTLLGRIKPMKHVSIIEQKESQFRQNCTTKLVATLGRKKTYSTAVFDNVPNEIINIHKQQWIDDHSVIAKNQHLYEIYGQNVPLNIIELQHINPSSANKYKLHAIDNKLVLYDPHNGLSDLNGFLMHTILGVYYQSNNPKELFILAYDSYNGPTSPYTFIKSKSDHILYYQNLTKPSIVKHFNSVEEGEEFNVTKNNSCYKLKLEEYQSMFKYRAYSSIS